MIQMDQNKIVLCGTVCQEPIFSHEVFGEKFYAFEISVRLLSGQSDCLPVIFSDRLCGREFVRPDMRLHIEGQLRTYNILERNKSHLRMQIFSREITEADPDEEDKNQIVLEGFVCKMPIYRVTPFSREIADLLLAVNRAYGKSDYIPTICWGRNARYAKQLVVSDKLHVEGRLQSRVYQKKIDDETTVERTTYEVSVSVLSKIDTADSMEPEMTEEIK